MSLYLINGPSGTGKTSIGMELHKRGYRVIDTDEDFGYYANLETEEPVEFPGADRVSADWYSKNGWLWKKDAVEKALGEDSNKDVFLCGGALNESQFYPKFSKIFRLVVDPETLVERIETRVGDEDTNNPDFIARMKKFLKTARSDAEKMGWAVIDTSHHTVEESTDEILDYVNKH